MGKRLGLRKLFHMTPIWLVSRECSIWQEHSPQSNIVVHVLVLSQRQTNATITRASVSSHTLLFITMSMNASSEGKGDSAYQTDAEGDKSPHYRPSPHTRHFLDLPISRILLTQLLDFIRINPEGHEARSDYVHGTAKGPLSATAFRNAHPFGRTSHEANAEKTVVDGFHVSVISLRWASSYETRAGREASIARDPITVLL